MEDAEMGGRMTPKCATIRMVSVAGKLGVMVFPLVIDLETYRYKGWQHQTIAFQHCACLAINLLLLLEDT